MSRDSNTNKAVLALFKDAGGHLLAWNEIMMHVIPFCRRSSIVARRTMLSQFSTSWSLKTTSETSF